MYRNIKCAMLLLAGLCWLPGGMPASAALPDLAEADFVVSPTGRDSWSGRLATANADGTDGPFATLDRARQAVRQLKKVGPNRQKPIVVLLRDGTYRLARTCAFTPEDSGTAQAPVVYQAYPGESPTLSGGVVVTAWQRNERGWWTAKLPDVERGEWNFSQLFVGGQRRFRPRVPKNSYAFIAGELEPSAAAKGRGVDRFRFKAGDLRPDWANLGDVEVLSFHTWTMSRLRIASIEDKEHTVNFTGTTRGLAPYAKFVAGNRFLVENVREALGEPGEWYLDRPSGVLTYVPKRGEDSGQAQVVAPRLDTLIRLEGDPAGKRWVENLRFHGLSFEHSSWNAPPEGNSYSQAEVNLGAAIEARGARDCEFKECSLAHLGAYAIDWGVACKRNRVDSCLMADLGAGGVKIGETAHRTDEEAVASHNVVQNSLIAGGGRLHPAAVGVWIGHAHDNTIEHNEIRDLYYSGVSVGWSWGYGPSNAHHNRIAWNHIHQLGQGVLSDMGGIYTLGASPGTALVANRIHDVNSFGYGGWGIYFDEGSSPIRAEGNVVARCKTGNFHQHYGKENVLEQNIFVDSPGPQLVRTRAEPHLSFTFRHNIVAWSDGTLLGSNWDGQGVALDENLYWNGGQPVKFGGLDLDAWRKLGRDVHSLVADPKFRDPATDDFRIAADSPALKIGFRPTDISGAGRTGPRLEPEWLGKLPAAFPPPPPPQPIADDFESTAVGARAALATTSEENERATIRVSDQYAHGGKHSLRLSDGPGQSHRYNPHVYYRAQFDAGPIEGRFLLRHQRGAIIQHDWRDDANPYHTGPNLRIEADGTLLASGKKVDKVPEGTWVELQLRCDLGTSARGVYDLTPAWQ